MYYQKTLDHNTFQEIEPQRKPLTPIQSLFVVLIPICAITSWALVFMWAYFKNTTQMFLGGLNWDDKVANWHFVCMAGFFTFASIGVSAFRFLPLGKLRNKALHGLWHTCGVICFGVGLAAIVKSHDDGNSGNLWSLHSWIGVMAMALYGQNYILGFWNFASGLAAPEFKAWYIHYHKAIGDVAFVLVTAAVISGITEQNAFNGCYARVYDNKDEPDSNPAAHYMKMYPGCRLSNGAGLLVGITALLVFVVSKNIVTEKALAHTDNAPLLS